MVKAKKNDKVFFILILLSFFVHKAAASVAGKSKGRTLRVRPKSFPENVYGDLDIPKTPEMRCRKGLPPLGMQTRISHLPQEPFVENKQVS
ncbi:hypothetical protein JQM60_11025 [Butyricicoccus pullicaecorum]|nr:hypothetical protein [Butyricicoccus pullicaecorum]